MESQEHSYAGGDPRQAPKVLIVDDEQKQVELVRGYLLAEGFEVFAASDGITALETAQVELPDLLILDVMLPGLDGVEVCRRLRQFSDAYVLMLTARGEEIDKVVGLSVGADDYLTKPFSPRELVARVKAMLRRPRLQPPGNSQTRRAEAQPDLPPPLVRGDLVVDASRHAVSVRGEPVYLTPREFGLLATLAAHPGRVFTRDQLLQQVWSGEYYGDHVVDVCVTHLRKKLDDDPAEPRYIETVRGVGYRFRSPSPTPITGSSP
ncbi:MAG: response regulator transcription factor [Chloroflexi bacterium]|nr:response regulator transcription factor [Chloroflexota bacterium]